MNKEPTILREDNVLKLKIILLIIYCVFTVVIVLITNGSPEAWLQELLLQGGNAISGTSPIKVTS